MNTVAIIVGYLCIAAFCVLVIGCIVAWVLHEVIEVRTLRRDVAIAEYSKQLGDRLYGDAFWFSEDPPTQRLLQSVAQNLTRGVYMAPDYEREQWRKWRLQARPQEQGKE